MLDICWAERSLPAFNFVVPPCSTVEGGGEKKKKKWSPVGEASQVTVYLYWGQTWLTWGCRYSSKWITKTFTSKEGRRWKVVKVQTLQVEDPADAATTEHEKSIEPLTVDSIDSEQTLRCFLPNQPVEPVEFSRENGATFFSWNKVSLRIKRSIYISSDIWLLLSKVGPRMVCLNFI